MNDAGNRPRRLAPRPAAPFRMFAAILLAALTGPVDADDASPPIDQGRAQWSQARLKATKLFKSMEVSIGVTRPDAATVESRLITSDTHALRPVAEPVTALHYNTEGLGRHREIELFFEPDTGQVLQRTSLETGKRYKHRVFRFGNDGALRRTRRPEQGEEKAGPDGWSDRSEQFFPTGSEAGGQTLTEPGTMIYLIAASKLENPGDRFELLAFSTSDETVYRIEALVEGFERVDVDYRIKSATDSDDRQGRLEAIRVSINGNPLRGSEDGDLTVLGMKDVELLLDPGSRAPLQLRGRVAVFGRITFKLRKLDEST